MKIKKIFKKLFEKSDKLVGVWETKHLDLQNNLMRLYEDGTGIIIYWIYEINVEPHQVIFEINWKTSGFQKVAFKLKNEKKFTSIKYCIKRFTDSEGNIYDELYDPDFSIGDNKDIKFFWKVYGKLYRLVF